MFCWRVGSSSLVRWLEHVTQAQPLWLEQEPNPNPTTSTLVLLGNCLKSFELLYKGTEHFSYRAAVRTGKHMNLCNMSHVLSIWLEPRILGCLSLKKKKSCFSNLSPTKSQPTKQTSKLKTLWPQTQTPGRTKYLTSSALLIINMNTVAPLIVWHHTQLYNLYKLCGAGLGNGDMKGQFVEQHLSRHWP